MDKKGIELSINFLVIIIISLAVFGMGIVFVNKIFFSAAQKVDEMGAQTKNELARLLDQGDKVAMPFFQETVIHGKTATFGIGVLNTLTASSTENFTIVVEFDEAYRKDNSEICNAGDTSGCGSDPDGEGTQEDNGWLAYDQKEHTIKSNEQGSYTIAINPPKDTPTGVYIFNVAVCYDVPPSDPLNDLYESASNICTGTYDYGYYNLQKIWLSVR